MRISQTSIFEPRSMRSRAPLSLHEGVEVPLLTLVEFQACEQIVLCSARPRSWSSRVLSRDMAPSVACLSMAKHRSRRKNGLYEIQSSITMECTLAGVAPILDAFLTSEIVAFLTFGASHARWCGRKHGHDCVSCSRTIHDHYHVRVPVNM